MSGRWKQHNVAIGFDLAGFAYIGEHRCLVVALLRATIELADRDDGDIEFREEVTAGR